MSTARRHPTTLAKRDLVEPRSTQDAVKIRRVSQHNCSSLDTSSATSRHQRPRVRICRKFNTWQMNMLKFHQQMAFPTTFFSPQYTSVYPYNYLPLDEKELCLPFQQLTRSLSNGIVPFSVVFSGAGNYPLPMGIYNVSLERLREANPCSTADLYMYIILRPPNARIKCATTKSISWQISFSFA